MVQRESRWRCCDPRRCPLRRDATEVGDHGEGGEGRAAGVGTSHDGWMDGLAEYYAGNFDAKPKFPTPASVPIIVDSEHHLRLWSSARRGAVAKQRGSERRCRCMHASSRITDDEKKATPTRRRDEGDPNACPNEGQELFPFILCWQKS